ncbi:hypothetical protein [Mesorhizobium sp. M7A.F.Ca.MR.362.00.0.0]|uniref:hypothetical protein n=1 Tax=Mesorhizobium sp. M7A.F.Ca.MR.362.00.0.0 TaxID=2496779 RepID=UPI000FD39866|nr:hypothetical protein [Mesorhizobium sp. M7A.F.Ca.MR.362.00.0.0]RUU79427.1 hypothetical protein EOC06_16130 [Mesorhizobium sp. M7A.F.Ca.MR.362.00.0.0]RWN89888.1 MAG: hypothetical protein EOS05_28585 [Mesorhizobium sp.]
MTGSACNQRRRCATTTPNAFYFRLATAKSGIAVFCPHGGDKGFRLRIGTGSKACAKGGFV